MLQVYSYIELNPVGERMVERSCAGSIGVASAASIVGRVVGLVGAMFFVTATGKAGVPKLSGKKYK